MISSSCDLKQFMEEIKDREYSDIIYLADQEAVEAWRQSRRRKDAHGSDKGTWARYADILDAFIQFMRYGVKPPGIDHAELQLFRLVRDNTMPKPYTGPGLST